MNLSAAAVLYGPPSAQPSTPPQPAASPAAEQLYGDPEPSDEPAPPSGDDLYGATDPLVVHRSAAHAIESAAVQDFMAAPEEAQEIAAGWAATFATYNLNSDESSTVAEIGAIAMRNPPTEEMQDTWAQQSMQALQRDFGAEGAAQALQDARMYVASLPGAADQIDALGLGDHPALVRLSAAKGRAMRLAGKAPR